MQPNEPILNEKILDSLLEGFQLISFDWKYLYVNDTVCKHGKSSKKELIGYTMMEKYPGIEKTDMFSVLKKCMEERTSASIENHFIHIDGSSQWFELRIEPVSTGLFILTIDITERKKIENELQKLNDTLEELVREKTSKLKLANKEITDSIIYAKRIQIAKLPNKVEIQKELPNSFILFKPKSIVSGDFYYFHKKNDKSIFIASVDCTGHGVPGAFMSMIGSEKLDEALSYSEDTSEILSHLNKGVKSSLKQSESYESIRDGMDIALCSVDSKERIVKFAGANRPIWVIRNGQKTIEEIKATRKAIGGFTDDDQHFESYEIKLEKGDTFYIFTDGYVDQFGGQYGKKIKTRKFKEILLNIQHIAMQDQKKYLDNYLNKWKAGTEQVDDILVIGIRL